MKKIFVFISFIALLSLFCVAQTDIVPTQDAQLDMNGFASIMALMGAFLLIIPLLFLALYIYTSLALMGIARKLNSPNAWLAWLPIGNLFLMADMANVPMWTIILQFIPPVNIGIMIWWWVNILKARGRPVWWIVLLIIPVVNLVILGILAWSGPKMSKEANPEIVNYIKQNKDKYPLAELRDALLKQGYPEHDIDKALIQANK